MNKLCLVGNLCLLGAMISSGPANAGCNNANGTEYTLSLTGETTVPEGYSLNFSIIVDPSTASLDDHNWTVTRTGGPAEILKDCTVTASENGLSATIVFYWYPGATPGKYKVQFDSGGTGGSDCIVEKTVTVALPHNGAVTSAISHGIYDTTFSGGYITLNSTGWTCSDPQTSWNIPVGSPFMEGRDGREKIPEHEAQHVSDQTGGEAAPAAVHGAALLANLCAEYLHTQIEFMEFSYLKIGVSGDGGWHRAVNDEIKEWTEDNAYRISDQIWPTCAYQDPGRGNR